MANPFSSWGSSSTASSGPFSSWGGNYHYDTSAASTGHSLLSGIPGVHLVHQLESLPTNIVQGLYSTGKYGTEDVIGLAEGKAPTHLLRGVIEPTIHAYRQKYGGLFTGHAEQTLHNIGADPLGTILDVAALGTIPFGGEGLAIRGAAAVGKVGEESALAGRLADLANAAQKAREDRLVTHNGVTFPVSRARTVQGRYLYNPIREAVGAAKGGELPVVGNAARSYKELKAQRFMAEADKLRELKAFEQATRTTVRAGATGLTRAENVAAPIAAEYGPAEAQAADLGVPRLQRVTYYKRELAKTKDKLGQPDLGRKTRSVLKAQARAQQRIVGLLSGSDKFAKQIDEALKNPRENLVNALDQARQLTEAQGHTMVAAGHADPAALEERRFLAQKLMHDFTWQGGEEAGFVGGSKPLEQIKAEHASAFYYPHLGPELKSEFPPARSGNALLPGETKRSKGIRYQTGQLAQGTDPWIRARAHWIKYDSANLVRDQAVQIGQEYDGHNLLPGHVPFNIGQTIEKPGGGTTRVTLARSQRESAALDEHFHNLTDEEHARATDQLINEMFPPHVPGQANATWQVPESFAKSIKSDYSQANALVRKFIDRPLEVWKAVVLKYRPAWLVNNILGQHLLLLLHNAGGLGDYYRALSPENRKKIDEALPGLMLGSTGHLFEKNALEDAGFQTGLRARVKGGHFLHGEEGRGAGGIVGQAAYRAVSYPLKAVKAVGDGAAVVNREVADNQTRTALAYRYIREYKQKARSLEIANKAVESAVKGKSLEQIAHEMPVAEKLVVIRKVNDFLGDFNTLTGKWGRRLRRAVPFAAWFKVILEISRDLTLDHPEKLLLMYNLEKAAKLDPSSVPSFNVPSWFLGSLVAPGFQQRQGEKNLISTATLNPFATPVQLADQLSVLFASGTPSGTQSPVASLGPAAEAVNLLQGYDPFYGGTYKGPGDKSSGLARVALGIGAGLPAVRLANEAGVPFTGKYKPAQSYNDRFANIAGVPVPYDAILRYLGLPIRRANVAKLQEYAQRGL